MRFWDRLRRGGTIDRLPPPPRAVGGGSASSRRSVPPADLERLAGGADRICVVDCETTGVYAADRIVELAIVTLALDGTVLETWDTLIHPRRDVGATHIHGITAAMLHDAPTFDDVIGDVALRLHGGCVAAHNLPFDLRMLDGEFKRSNVDLLVPAGIDTLAATRCRLSIACATHGIDLHDAHSALADALATAHLLRAVASACQIGAPAAVPTTPLRSGRVFPRADAAPVPVQDPPHIAALATTLDHSGLEANMLAYLDVVDRAVADLHLDADERVELASISRELGLDEPHRAQAHRRLLNDLIDAALDDHVVTPDELDVLLRVAAALEMDPELVERRTRPARAATVAVMLEPGIEVVFTGDDPSRPRPALVGQAEQNGFVVSKNVTTRTGLVVAFDPESGSGKASKARSYGVPIISTAQFADAAPGDTLDAHCSAIEAMKVITCPDCHANWTVSARTRTQASRRCRPCAQVTRANQPAAAPAAAPSAPQPVIEELRCDACARTWTREVKRGRKPSRCPDCV